MPKPINLTDTGTGNTKPATSGGGNNTPKLPKIIKPSQQSGQRNNTQITRMTDTGTGNNSPQQPVVAAPRVTFSNAPRMSGKDRAAANTANKVNIAVENARNRSTAADVTQPVRPEMTQIRPISSTPSRSLTELYTNTAGAAQDNGLHRSDNMASMKSRIDLMWHDRVQPAYQRYEQAMSDYNAGKIDFDSAMSAYNDYMTEKYQYDPIQQAYETLLHSGDAGATDQSSYEDILAAMDRWDQTIGEAETNLARMDSELERLSQQYTDAVALYDKNPSEIQARKVNTLREELLQKTAEQDAAWFVYSEMAGNFDGLNSAAEAALLRDYPEVGYARNIGYTDSDGKLHLTKSAPDMVKMIENLQDQAWNTTDEEEKAQLLKEADWYLYALQLPSMYADFSADEVQEAIDYLDQRIQSLQQGEQMDMGLPTTEAGLDAFLLQNGYDRATIDAAIREGYTREQLASGVQAEILEAEGKDPYSLTGGLPEDRYNYYVTQMSIIRNGLRRMERGKIYDEAIQSLPGTTRDRMENFIAAGTDAGMDLTDLILNPDSASTASTRLLLRDSSPGILTEIEELKKEFKDAGFTDEEAEGLLLYAAREINDNRVAELMTNIANRSEQQSEVLNFLSTVGNSFTQGAGHFTDLLRFVGYLDGGRDPFTGEFYIDPNAQEHDMYHTVQANELKRQERVHQDITDIFGEGKFGEKMAEMANKLYGLSISMGQSNAIRGLSMLGLPATTLLLGASAGEARTMEMLDRGYSDGAALVAGVIAATGETLSEKVSLDHFMKGLRSGGKGLTTGQWIWQAITGRAGQGGVEMSEEVASDIFQFFGDYLVVRWLNGGVSEIDMRANEIRLAARAEDPPRDISWDEAKKQAEKDWIAGVGEDAIGGLMSGILMGDGQVMAAASNYVSDYKTGKAAIGIDNWLADHGFEPRMVAEVQRIIDSIDTPTAVASRIRNGSELRSAYDVGHAINQLQDARITDAINQRLQDLGVTDVSPTLVSAVDAASHGYRLSAKERAALNNNSAAQQVVEELSAVWDGMAELQGGAERPTLAQTQEFLTSTFDNTNSSWAVDAIITGQDERSFFMSIPDLRGTASRVQAAYPEQGTRTKDAQDPVMTIEHLLQSGVATKGEINDILDNAALRAEFERQTGEKLSGRRRDQFDAVRKYLIATTSTPEQIQYQRTKNANPDATVQGASATMLADAGMADANRRLTQGKLLDSIFSGEDLSPFDLRSLNLADPAVRRVFARRSGMTNLPTVITAELKEALVNKAVDAVRDIRAKQEAIMDSAEQLQEAQMEQATEALNSEVSKAVEESKAKKWKRDKSWRKKTRAENRAEQERNMSRAYETRLASGGRRRRIETHNRTEQDVVRQIVAQSGVKGLQSKSSFEMAYRAYMGIEPGAKLTKEQRMGLDSGYDRYLINKNLTAQERDALHDVWAKLQRKAARRGERVQSEERHPYDENLKPTRDVEGTVTFDSSVDYEALKKEGGIRWASVQVLRRLAKSLGVNFRIYATTEQDGERVWIDGDGKKHSDNGMYDPSTNEILIDLNAGGGGQGTMLFTTAHELVHWMRDFHAKSYDALANYLLDMYADNGNDVHELQQAIIDKYAKKGITLTMDGTALEELVARSMEAMLTDGNVLQNLESLRNADRGAFERVVEYIQNLVEKIKKLYKQFKPDTAEARYVQEMGNAFLDLQQLFTEGLVNASKSFKVNSSLAHNAKPVNTQVSEKTAEDLAKIGSVEIDGVVVSDENAELMEEEGFEKPQDPLDQAEEQLMHSERTEEAWEATYQEKGGDQSVIEAMKTFIGEVRQNDAIMRFIPTGEYKYQKKGFGPLRKNVEYIRTFDMDASCPRTFQFVNYRNRLQQIAGRPLTDSEAFNLMFVMRRMNQQIPCTYCYVENKRILKSISYLNYFKFRTAVMSAATDEEALPLMYSYNEKTGKVSDAAKKVFDEWRSEAKKGTAFCPSAEETWTGFQTAKNSVWNWLDQQLEDGAIKFGSGVKKPTSNKQISALVNEHFDVTNKAAQREIAGMIEKWQYDILAGVNHNYEITNDEDTSEVNQDILEVHRLASNYAASSSQARNVDDYVPYTDEVKNLSAKDKAFIVGMGGIRKHSSNDFRIDYVIDYFQFFADLAREKITGHTYTKSVEYCKIFGRTGDRINLSIAMDTVNGKIVPNTQEGADWNDAKELRKHYGDLGVMALVTDDAQLSFALNSDWIDMMIPFHASGLPKEVWGNIRAWFDYTSVQLESYYTLNDMKAKLDEKGVSYAHLLDTTARVQELMREGKNEKDAKSQASAERKAAIENLFYETYNIKIIRNKNGQRVKPHFFPGETKIQGPHGMQTVPGHGNDVKKYFELCEQYGVHPRFKGIKVSDKDGNIIDVTEHPGYLKLIKETARTGDGVLDNDYEQKPIRFSFNEVDPYLSKLMGKDTTPMQYALQQLQLNAESNGYENLKDNDAAVLQIFEKLYLGKDRPTGWMPERPNMEVPGRTEEEELARMMYTYIEEVDKAYSEMHDADLRLLSDEQKATMGLMKAPIDEEELDTVAPGPETMSSLRETDPGVLKFLNDQVARGEYIRTYKSYLEVIEDGQVKLYAPMAVRQKGPDGKKRFSNPLAPGQWEKSVGNVESKNIVPSVEKGRRKINKRTGRPAWDYQLDKETAEAGGINAAYNPYQHSSDYVLNDQFAKAYSRPKLVTYECIIPLSEMTSGYAYSEVRSDGEIIDAKDAVGKHQWKKGPVAEKLKNTDRQVYMTRWLMPIRRLSNAEVAQQYKEIVDREDTPVPIPFNTVTPGLQLALERLGVPIDYEGEGKYRRWHNNNPTDYPNGKPILGTTLEAEIDAAEQALPEVNVELPTTTGYTYRAEDITQGLNFRDPSGILLRRIASREKQYETRNYTDKRGNGKIPAAYLNRPMGIVQTFGNGTKAKLVGFWELGDGQLREPYWLAENKAALGNDGTEFEAKPGERKWVYPIKWAVMIDPIEIDSTGITARDISGITSQMADVMLSARETDDRNLTSDQRAAKDNRAVLTAEEAEKQLNEMLGKGEAKKLAQTVRAFERRAIKAEQKAEIEKEKASLAEINRKAEARQAREEKRDANKTIKNLSKVNNEERRRSVAENRKLQQQLDQAVKKNQDLLNKLDKALEENRQKLAEVKQQARDRNNQTRTAAKATEDKLKGGIRSITAQQHELRKELEDLQKQLAKTTKHDEKMIAQVDELLAEKQQLKTDIKDLSKARTAERNELRRQYMHTIFENGRVDKMWAKKLYESGVKEARREGREAQRRAVEREELTRTGRGGRARRIMENYSKPGAQISVHDETEPLPELFTNEKPLLFPKEAGIYTVNDLFKRGWELAKRTSDAFLRRFENYAQEIDRMAREQGRPDNLSVKVSAVRAAKAVPARIWDYGLVTPEGNAEGPAMNTVLLCLDDNGKIDVEMQNDLNTFMVYQHTMDRMSIVERAENRRQAFVERFPYLEELSASQLAERAALGEKNVLRYLSLVRAVTQARNKAVVGWGDELDTAVNYEEARKYVEEVQATKPELVKKANAIYDYWDAVMRIYAVGTLISEEQYDVMREIYPHYIPTYREMGDEERPISSMIRDDSLTAAPATKEAKGSTRKLLRLEDQYVKALQQIVRAYHENNFLQQLIGEFMFDTEGTYDKYGFFDWDSVNPGIREYVWDFLGMQNDTNAEQTKDGKYKITCYVNGEKMSAYITRPMFEGIKGLFDKHTTLYKKAVRLGGKITNPAKQMITGANATFAIKNLERDVQTALINSVAGANFLTYQAIAAGKMLRQDHDWITFQNLGGVSSSKIYNESGFAPKLDRRLAVLHARTKAEEGLAMVRTGAGSVVGKIGDAISIPGEMSESVSRFAEYLATLDMLGGDSYINRQVAIRNAAEVTVDFGRRGLYGSLINSYVMYWNPGMQGLSKAFRVVFSQPTNLKKLKALGKAIAVSIIPAALQSMVLYGTGNWDEYKKLSDRIKDQNFCFPLEPVFGEKFKGKFFKVPRTQDWGVFISAPFLRMLEGKNGRENPMDHYLRTAIIPNMPVGTPLPVDWILQYITNKDSFGSIIVPYDLQSASAREQWDADTSWMAKTIGEAINLSPMKLDQFIEDYMGNFWGPILRLIPYSPFSPVGYYTGETTVGENMKDAWQLVKSPFIADNRYSSSIRSDYYDLYNQLQQAFDDAKAHGDPKTDMEEYDFYKALTMTNGYANQISALMKKARDLPPGEEKDMYYEAMTGLCNDALEFYKAWKDGDVKDAVHWMTYSRYGELIMNETLKLREYDDDYEGDFNFSGMLGNPEILYDRSGDLDVKFNLKDLGLQEIYNGLRAEKYQQILTEVLTSPQYNKPGATKEYQAKLLEDAKSRAMKEASQDMLLYLEGKGITGETIGKPDYDLAEREAAYALSQILGDDDAYDEDITDTLIRLYDWNDEYNFAPTQSSKETFTSLGDKNQLYVLSDAQADEYARRYHDKLTELYHNTMALDEFKTGDDEMQALLLAKAKSWVPKLIGEDFEDYLIRNGAVSQDRGGATDVMNQEAEYAIQRAFGYNNSYPKELTDELIRLWDYKDDFSFMPSDVSKSYFTDPTNNKVRYILNTEQSEKYTELYNNAMTENLLAIERSAGYDSLSDEEKVRRLAQAKTYAMEKANEEFGKWITRQDDVETETRTSDEMQKLAALWDVQRVLGHENALSVGLTDEALRLYDLNDVGSQSFLPNFSPPTSYVYVNEDGKQVKGYKWFLDKDQREVYTAMAYDIYDQRMQELMSDPIYRSLDEYGQAMLMCAMRAQVTTDTRLAFQQWLRESDAPVTNTNTAEAQQQAANEKTAKTIIKGIVG